METTGTQKTSAEETAEQMTLRNEVKEQGYAIVPDVLDTERVHWLQSLVEAARRSESNSSVANNSGTYGLRNLIDVIPELAELIRLPGPARLVEQILGPDAFMTRATLFDKTPGANWGVFWHQDLSIAVQERHDVDGFEAWTRKAGVQCVQPPTELMQHVLAVRFHLDDCTADNGPLKVLPGTHHSRRLSTAEIETHQTQSEEVTCEVSAGGAVIMRPLLLHASSPMEVQTCRRVVHCEFASLELPPPLKWRYQVSLA